MAPSRHTPRANPPSRRPRVAGLRKPAGPSPKPGPSPRPRPEPEGDQPEAAQAEAAQAEVEQAEVEQAEAAQAETLEASSGPDTTGPEQAPEQALGKPAAARESDAAERPKPSPRRKARDTGARRPESEQEITRQERVEPEGAARQVAGGEALRRRRYVLAAVLGVVVLAFAGLAVVFQLNRTDINSATANQALLDVAKTAQVQQEVDAAVEALFSYDFNDIAKTERAANDLLVTDEVREQYNKEFAEVKRLAPEQKIVVSSNVTRSAVVTLHDDRARVLVFVDQTSTRTDQGQTNTGGSQLAVTTELRDGSWKITGLNTYSEELPQQQPAPQQSQQQSPGAGEQPQPSN